MSYSRYFRSLEDLLAAENPDQDAIKKKAEELKAGIAGFFKNYNKATDNRLTRELLGMYFADVPREQQPEFMLKEGDKSKGDFSAFTDAAASGRVRLLYRARYHDRIHGTAPANYYEEVLACSG